MTLADLYTATHDFATLLSLYLTWPALFVAAMVLIAWHNEYIAFCTSNNRTPSQFLIAGIYIGFFGSFIDNAYWGAAWTLDYISTPKNAQLWAWREWFFQSGVFSNVPFRQTALIYAGCLHVSAEIMSRKVRAERERGKRRFLWGMGFSALFGAVYVAALMTLK